MIDNNFCAILSHRITCVQNKLIHSITNCFRRKRYIDTSLHSASSTILNHLLTIGRFRITFLKWKEAFECNCLKISHVKAKLMVSGGITRDVFSECKVDPCGVYNLTIKVNLVLFIQCGKWIHSRCAGV